jgi:erythromycin esterase-like protein
LKEGERSPTECVAEGVFPIWTLSAQLAPLWRYLADEASGARPLELAGYDSQVTGRAAALFASDLVGVLAMTRLKAADIALVTEGARAAAEGRGVADAARAKSVAKACEAAAKAVVRAEEADDAAFWAQVLQSLGAEVERLTSSVPDSAPIPARFNPRDRIGGENLVWLANERYRGRKLVVWLATMHGLRDPAKIDTLESGFDYTGVEPAGLHLTRALKGAAYTVGFVCAQGRGGLPWQAPGPPLAPPVAGSFEALCVAAGLQRHFVDLRSPPRQHWLREPLVARPLGHRPMRAEWPEVLDALVFVRELTPSTAAPPDIAVPPFDLVPAVVRELDAAIAGERDGNVWAAKWQSAATVERWLASNRPAAAEIESAEGALSESLDGYADGDTRRWRALDALATLAAARGAGALAAERWHAALAAHPPVTAPDPAKHSGFQHLLNRAACHIARTEDAAAAAALVAATVGADPRCKAVQLDDWNDWLTGDALRAVQGGFRRGLEARMRTYPAESEWIRRALTRLDGE